MWSFAVTVMRCVLTTEKHGRFEEDSFNFIKTTNYYYNVKSFSLIVGFSLKT